jgi:hypothetical protein
MRIALIFIILSIVLLISTIQAQTNFVFPFDTTSKWEYDIKSSFDPPFMSVGHTTLRFLNDTIMPNGRSYKPFSDGRRKIFYLRKDSSRIFQYWDYDSTEFIRYDFSKSPGDTVSHDCILSTDRMLSVFGISRRVMSFTGDIILDNVVDTIGMLNFNPGGTDISYQLTGADINGHIYGILTKVTDKIQIIPKDSFLYQNYPNPFNPSTSITFNVPLRTHVVVTIYNLLGSMIGKYLDKEMDPGIHSIVWNASGYCSGVYFYTLKTESVCLTKSMLLLK